MNTPGTAQHVAQGRTVLAVGLDGMIAESGEYGLYVREDLDLTNREPAA